MNLIDKNKCQDNDQYVADGIPGKILNNGNLDQIYIQLFLRKQNS